MVFHADRTIFRVARFAVVCQSLIGRLPWGQDGSPRVLSRGESEPLPRPGVYALLAGFDRH